MKRVYEQPRVVVKTFFLEDVITTSGGMNSWQGEYITDPYDMGDFQ